MPHELTQRDELILAVMECLEFMPRDELEHGVEVYRISTVPTVDLPGVLVETGRIAKKHTDAVLAVADGDVWVGAEAVEKGLVDGIANLQEAIETARAPQRLRGRDGTRAQHKEPVMAEKKKTEAEQTQEAPAAAAQEQERADVVKTAVEEALKGDRQRRAAIQEAVGDYADIVLQADVEGWTVDQAKAAAFEKAKAKIGELDKQLKEANERLETAAKAGLTTPTKTPGGDEGDGSGGDGKSKAGDDGRWETYQARIDELIGKDNKGAQQAHRIARKELPKACEAWTEHNQGS